MMKNEKIKKDDEIKENREGNTKRALMLVIFFYGMLFMLVAVLTSENEDKLSFWMYCIGVGILLEVLQMVAKHMSLLKLGKITNLSNYISFFIVEMGTIIICVVISLTIVKNIREHIYDDSKYILLTIGFAIILLLYELILWFRSCLIEKYKIQKEYGEFKKAFEDKYNMVNLMTIPSAILTFMVLASGIEKASSDIATDFFLSCSVVYVLLIHYCGKNRLNEKAVNE